METTVEVQWNMYIEYGSILLGTYANNVKCMFTRAPCHIVDGSELI